MNYKMLIGKGTLALASYSDDTGIIRLQVYPSTMSSRQTPGVHYFLYFPSWQVWESHPFSLAGRSGTADASRDSEKNRTATVVQADVDARPHFTFMIRPQTGMTRRLRDSLRSAGQRRVRVLLDGPYGAPANLCRFKNVLFVVGGSGITAVLPYIRSLFEDAQGPSTPNVQLKWVVREEGFARDVLANDLPATHASPMAPEKLQQTIYITAPSPVTSDSDSSRSGDTQFVYSRPDIRQLVDEAVTAASGKTAVFVCGPAKMADDARAAVRLRVGERDVELFEEMYGW